MASEADWREAARGIPVWARSRVWALLPGGREWVLAEPVAIRTHTVTLARVDDPMGALTVPICDVIPDLSDPDTRAAYDRRLALALGCPDDALEWGYGGVRFWPVNQTTWRIDAGAPGSSFAWRMDLAISTLDAAVARALAWPADKRVKP